MGFVVNWMFVWWELEGCGDGLWEQKHKEEMAAAAAAGMVEVVVVVWERKREERRELASLRARIPLLYLVVNDRWQLPLS